MRKKNHKLSRSYRPPFWRKVAEGDKTCCGELALVLSAKAIPWYLSHASRNRQLYVPALLEQRAMRELALYESENRPNQRTYVPWTLYHDWAAAPIYLIPLVLVYALQHGWLLQDGRILQKRGALDAIQVILHSEWPRLATALTLHNGIVHLVGNVCFGAFFLALLARLCGYGHAWLLSCLGGILGNGLSVLTHKLGYASIGFSTALFATVGAIAGVLLWRISEKIFMPFAAALAFLAMLGVEGANTDYAAHICGLCAGGILGLIEGSALRHNWRLLPQTLAALLALLIPAGAWWLLWSR